MRKVPLAVALILSALYATSSADTVTLLSGEKLQGKIISESASEVTLDIHVSAAISDQRTLRRDEIQKIEKTPPDDIDFEPVKDLKPDPLIAQPAVIDADIARLNAFLTQYPQSSHCAAVKTLLEAFKKEKDHLTTGDVKYYGTWISKSQAAERKLQLEGVGLYVTMRSQAASGDFIGALNTFDQLDKSDSTTRIYPQAVLLDRKVLEALDQQVNRDIAKLKNHVEEWSQGLAVTPDTQKPQIIAAQKAEQDKYDAIIDAAGKSGVKWIPLLPGSAKDLDALAALATSENARLTVLPLDKMNASVQIVDKARQAFEAQDNDKTDALLKQAVTLWPQNEDATYLQKAVTDLRAEEAKKAEAAAKATPKPTATPKPSAAAAQPASTPIQVVDEEKPSFLAFFMTIPGAMCVVGGAIVLLIIVTVLQKIKKPKSEDIE
ncbi:MAG: PTPDL family protein [Chthoniobacteraceae bacterium]